MTPVCASFPKELDIDSASAPTNATGTSLLHLAQPWLPKPEKEFRPGTVRIGRKENLLQIEAILKDDFPFTRATASHQLLWQLGDVFEVFLQAPNRVGYHEFHLAPGGQTLQLYFPEENYIKTHPEISIEDTIIKEPLFTSHVEIVSGGWNIGMVIPLDRLWGTASVLSEGYARISFGRYDYPASQTAPVCSSTSPHQKSNFHRVHEWTHLRF